MTFAVLWPWLVVAVPLAAAGGLGFTRGMAAWSGAVAVAGMTLALAAALAVTGTAADGTAAVGLRVDKLAVHLAVLVAAAGLLAAWGARRAGGGGRAAQLLGVLAAIELAVLAEAAVVAWVGLAAAGLLLLAGPPGDAGEPRRARQWQALLALVLGLAAALCGVLLLAQSLAVGLAAARLWSLGFVLLLGGLAGAAGLAPLHGWVRAAGAGGVASSGLVPGFAAVALMVVVRAGGVAPEGALDPGLGLLALGMASLGWAAVAAWRGGGSSVALPFQAGLAAVAFGLGSPVADAAGLMLLSGAVLMVPLLRPGGGVGQAGLLAALALVPPFPSFVAALALLGETVRQVPWLAVPLAVVAAMAAAGLARMALLAWRDRVPSRSVVAQSLVAQSLAAQSLAGRLPALLVLALAVAAGLAPPVARWFATMAEGLR